MIRLLAMFGAFAVFVVVLGAALTTWTFGEVVSTTSHPAYRREAPYTRCTAQIAYQVDGKSYWLQDVAEVSGHVETSACPFDARQTAVVIYPPSNPGGGSAYTSTGDGWMYLFGSLVLFPMAVAVRLLGARAGRPNLFH